MVTLDELLEKVPRMDDDISKFLRELKHISVSFTPEDFIPNMASICRFSVLSFELLDRHT
jgi:hypothetical protein